MPFLASWVKMELFHVVVAMNVLSQASYIQGPHYIIAGEIPPTLQNAYCHRITLGELLHIGEVAGTLH